MTQNRNRIIRSLHAKGRLSCRANIGSPRRYATTLPQYLSVQLVRCRLKTRGCCVLILIIVTGFMRATVVMPLRCSSRLRLQHLFFPSIDPHHCKVYTVTHKTCTLFPVGVTNPNHLSPPPILIVDASGVALRPWDIRVCDYPPALEPMSCFQ